MSYRLRLSAGSKHISPIFSKQNIIVSSHHVGVRFNLRKHRIVFRCVGLFERLSHLRDHHRVRHPHILRGRLTVQPS